MTTATGLILVLWLGALAAFFVVARPAPAPAITYLADTTVAGWVEAVGDVERQSSGLAMGPAPPGTRPSLTIGRLPDGAKIATTRLVIGAWQGSPAETVASPERLASWRAAVRDGRVRFAVPGRDSALGKDLLALAQQIDGTAADDFYRGTDRRRERDDLYLDDFRNFGPARWDAGLLYEDVALQINKRREDEGATPLLQILYFTDAPVVEYRADGLPAGDRLIAALATPRGQSLALDYGIRPLDPTAASAASLFARFSALGAEPPQ